MGAIVKHAVFCRIGVHSTPTDRLGTVSVWRDLPVFEDGVGLGGGIESFDVPTEHKDPGVKYGPLLGKRNAGGGPLRTPIYPENAKFLFDFATSINGANGLPSYHTVEQYWTTTLTGSATGRELVGVLGDGVTLSFDRTSPGAIEMAFDAYVNADFEITTAVPTPTFPAQNPYQTGNVYVDLVIADDTNTLGAFTGNNPDLRSLSVSLKNNIEINDFNPSTIEEYSNTWTQAYPGVPTLELQGKLVATNSAYLNLLRIGDLRKIKARIMGVGSSPSDTGTCTSSLAAAATSIPLATGTGTNFDVGDYILLSQGTANKQQVTRVTATGASSLTVDALDIAMDGTAETITISNTAFELRVDLARISSATPPTIEGNVRVVNFTATATLAAGSTSLVTVRAYNDDND